MDQAQKFIYTRTYSRWLEEESRREAYEETVDRYLNFIKEKWADTVPTKVFKKIRARMLELSVLPSMRALWAAGPAATNTNVAMYNCAYADIDSVDAFAEALYILMCGTGYGFSVQHECIKHLPEVPKINWEDKELVTIEDSKEGWASSIKVLMRALYNGKTIDFDYSLLRTKGSRLKTFGGRASGPEPLIVLHSFIKEVFQTAQERKLTSLECLDILNQIAEVVVVGGVRRSSEISLSDLADDLVRNAKVWPFPQRRAMSNNSAVYMEKPTAIEFLKEWAALADSGTGERGIFNLEGVRKHAPGRRDVEKIHGTNPCGEIMLRSNQFCNLSEVVVRSGDDLDDLLEKVETATWIGAIQSTYTDFPFLSKKWRKNCEEERLLGVSLTGQMDNPALLTADALKALKARAIRVAKHAAGILGINVPTAITCVKPSGTVSQLVNSASGLHPRYAAYYIRRYRIAATDPLCKLLKSQGIDLVPENGQEKYPEDKVNTWVVSFPVKSPDKAITRDKVAALAQLDWYKRIQTNWCEHNASCTVYVKDIEWFEVGNWVYANWEIVNGISFLPYDGGHYKNAPYEEITEAQYKEFLDKFPEIDYSRLSEFEQEDLTEGNKSYSCVGDRCELN